MAGLFTAADRQAISDAIRQVENRSSGELVTVIAPASDDYAYIPTLWAALLSLAVPALVLLFTQWLEYVWVYGAQLLVFVLLALLFRIPGIKLRLIPAAVKQQRASRVAREQFFLQNLHHTRDRTGILLFVSVAERYVEVIADKGINDAVAADTWASIVDDFIGQVKAGAIRQGFIAAINACGEVLHEHFPAEPGNLNELPDHLIELP